MDNFSEEFPKRTEITVKKLFSKLANNDSSEALTHRKLNSLKDSIEMLNDHMETYKKAFQLAKSINEETYENYKKKYFEEYRIEQFPGSLYEIERDIKEFEEMILNNSLDNDQN